MIQSLNTAEIITKVYHIYDDPLYTTFLYRTLAKVYALAGADIIHSQRVIKEIFDTENSPFY